MAILLALASCGNPITNLEYNKIVCKEWHKSLQNRNSVSFACRQLFQGYDSIEGRKGFPREKDVSSGGYKFIYKTDYKKCEPRLIIIAVVFKFIFREVLPSRNARGYVAAAGCV